MATNSKNRYEKARLGNLESLEKRELFAADLGFSPTSPISVVPADVEPEFCCCEVIVLDTDNLTGHDLEPDSLGSGNELSKAAPIHPIDILIPPRPPKPTKIVLGGGREDGARDHQRIPKHSISNDVDAALAERDLDRTAGWRASEIDAAIADWEESMI